MNLILPQKNRPQFPKGSWVKPNSRYCETVGCISVSVMHLMGCWWMTLTLIHPTLATRLDIKTPCQENSGQGSDARLIAVDC